MRTFVAPGRCAQTRANRISRQKKLSPRTFHTACNLLRDSVFSVGSGGQRRKSQRTPNRVHTWYCLGRGGIHGLLAVYVITRGETERTAILCVRFLESEPVLGGDNSD